MPETTTSSETTEVTEEAAAAAPETPTAETQQETATSEPAAEETAETESPAREDEETDWKAEARKWEARARANKAAAPELEKLTAERDDLANQLKAAREELDGIHHAEALEKLVAKVAKDMNVPANLLRGTTEEELTAHAKEIFDAMPGLPIVRTQGDLPEAKDDPNRQVLRDLFGKNK